jgi:hypothetical protein
MGKRSDFEREKLDFYPTPMAAVNPLLQLMMPGDTFCEPCAGAGDLVRHLEAAGLRCVSAFDVEPRHDSIRRHDASFITQNDLNGAKYIITNPPWDRPPLHQIMERCSELAPTWLLFDADWMHTKQAAPYLPYCWTIISVGRVKWIADSDMAGKDNCCWYLFKRERCPVGTRFIGR